MSDQFVDSINESLRQSFESKWISEDAPNIDAHLPDLSDSQYLGTLEELVHIDLEFRWKTFGENRQQRPLDIETYLKKYPALDDAGIMARLVLAEFELRYRFGDEPQSVEYDSRFPVFQKSNTDIVGMLDRQKSALRTEIKPVTAGDQLGRYKLVAEHGRGGFGAVWRADDSKLDRRIALKRLSGQLSRQSESRRRFVSEARITAKLEHPGIVPVYDISNLDEEHAYYTMKLVRGATMAQFIERVHKLRQTSADYAISMRRLINALLDVCQTIKYCHARGVIHRDLKPQNIVMGDFGETILLDWGFASLVSDSDTESDESPVRRDDEILSYQESVETLKGQIQGTPAYMPPELARGEIDRSGPLTDIFSLGAILYQLITGEVPFTDGSMDDFWNRVQSGLVTRPTLVNKSAPAALEAICLKAMAPEPPQRYQNVSLLINDLQNYLADEPVSAYAEPLMARAGRWMRKHKAAVAGGVSTIVFLSIAAVISLIVWQQLEQREIARLNELRSRAERAEAAAVTQTHADQFEAGLVSLKQAAFMVKNVPSLSEFAKRVEDRQTRLQRIVDFYRLGEIAQEHLFFDRLRETTIYSQQALNRIGALQHVDWWNRLPSDDLKPIQKKQLRDQVYRQLGVMSSIRMAEKADEGFSAAWLTGVVSKTKPLEADAKISSAIFAAHQANRYRPARILQIVRDMGDLVLGNRDSINVAIADPLNPTDAAMLGSILDTHAPESAIERMLLQPFLAMRDPRETAQKWLLDAVTAAPDWYWLSIFIGTNEIRTGNLEKSIRSFSHAVGVKPTGWVGYLYRAIAYLESSSTTNSRRERAAFLRKAADDLQRARDLENDNSFLYWATAQLQMRTGESAATISQTFLDALGRHQRVDQILGGHSTQVAQLYFDLATNYVNEQPEDSPYSEELLALEAALLHWQGKNQLATKAVDRLLELNPDHPFGIGIRGLIMAGQATGSSPLDESQLRAAVNLLDQSLEKGQTVWLLAYDLAGAHEKLGQMDRAIETFRRASSWAITNWQQALTSLALARCLLKQGDFEQAVALFQNAIYSDLAVNAQSIPDELAKKSTRFFEVFDQHRQTVSPYSSMPGNNSIIRRPALMNGDFELGLSLDWGNDRSADSPSVWVNQGDSKAAANRIHDYSRRGTSFMLHIQNNMAADAEGRGYLTQVIPVTPGANYQVSVWCRGRDVTEGGLEVWVDGQAAIKVAKGSFDWQSFSGSFSTDKESIKLQIVTKGSAEAWVDDLQIVVND